MRRKEKMFILVPLYYCSKPRRLWNLCLKCLDLEEGYQCWMFQFNPRCLWCEEPRWNMSPALWLMSPTSSSSTRTSNIPVISDIITHDDNHDNNQRSRDRTSAFLSTLTLHFYISNCIDNNLMCKSLRI